jgi:hypothetical protein
LTVSVIDVEVDGAAVGRDGQEEEEEEVAAVAPPAAAVITPLLLIRLVATAISFCSLFVWGLMSVDISCCFFGFLESSLVSLSLLWFP